MKDSVISVAEHVRGSPPSRPSHPTSLGSGTNLGSQKDVCSWFNYCKPLESAINSCSLSRRPWESPRWRKVRFVFFWFWINAQITSGTHTDGGAVIRKPRSAWLEGTPAIHVTCLHVSWYVRVVDTHSILKCYFLDLSWHERATAWIFHVEASQNYWMIHLSSRRSDSGLTMQVSGFQDRPNMRAGAKGDAPEVRVVGRHLSIIRIYVQ